MNHEWEKFKIVLIIEVVELHMVTLTAIGRRDSDGVRVVPGDEHIPYLHQWVRDYVDERKVSDGMKVLVAEVNQEESDVERLTMNVDCASERAKREDERVDTIQIEEF